LNQTFAQKRQLAAEKLGISPDAVPRHIAIIMDGNGRWAQARGLERFQGHRQGAKSVEEIIKYGVEIGIECISLYSFSLQNWKRPAEEIEFLMHLFAMYLEGVRSNLMENNIRLVHIGRREPLPQNVLDALDGTVEMTAQNDGMVLALALNYGARTEIVDAVRRIAADYKDGKVELDEIDHQCISDNLYTASLPDPDILIRTSGEQRISNFLLWQISYSEFYVTDKMWPDFTSDDIDLAIKSYAQRSRRFGDTKAKNTN
jgi:undecaprenyl diphosphate synthase